MELGGDGTMSGKRSQAKGRRAEIELSKILQSYGYPVEAGRAQSYGEVPDLSGLPGIHIECKRAETLRLSEWMAQAERDAQRFGDGAPAIFFRRSRSPWCVVMKLEDWITIYTDFCRKKEGCNDTQETKSPGCAADTANKRESRRRCGDHVQDPAGLSG